MTSAPAKRLLDFKEFASRLGGRSVRTVERLYESGVPGLPKVVRLNRIKLVSEVEVDDFIERLLRNKALPGGAPSQPLVPATKSAGRGARRV